MSLYCCECGYELKAFASMRTIWKKRDMTVACIDLEACKTRRDERERQARNAEPVKACEHCIAAAKHAYSDATTPGFFRPYCATHDPDLKGAVR